MKLVSRLHKDGEQTDICIDDDECLDVIRVFHNITSDFKSHRACRMIEKMELFKEFAEGFDIALNINEIQELENKYGETLSIALNYIEHGDPEPKPEEMVWVSVFPNVIGGWTGNVDLICNRPVPAIQILKSKAIEAGIITE